MDMRQKLIQTAKSVVGRFSLTGYHKNYAGSTACALITKAGNIYTGVNLAIQGSSSIGSCAEQTAIAEMLKNRETEIEMIVSVSDNDDGIRTPCGACREMMLQIDKRNRNSKIVVDENTTKTLSEMLPHHWIAED